MLHPKTARTLYGAGIIVTVAAVFSPATITTRNGEIPFFVIMPAVGVLLGLRLAGVQVQIGQNLRRMPGSFRAASWLALAAMLFILGLIPHLTGLLILGAAIGLDLVGAAFAPDVDARPTAGKSPWLRAWVLARAPLVIAAALGSAVGFHFLVARYFPVAYLLDWTYLSLLGALALRLVAGTGDRLPWQAAEPPEHHRVHRRVERPVADPMKVRVDEAVRQFLDEGDAAGLLAAARDAARLATLTDAQTERLEEDLMQALARAGTSRHADLDAALRVLDEAFSRPAELTVNA